MPNIYEIADEFRAALLKNESAAVDELKSAYELAWAAISGEMQAATAKASDAPSAADVLRIRRLGSISAEIEKQMMRLAALAGKVTKREQRKAADAALWASEAMLRARQPDIRLAHFSASDFEKLVGVTRDGTLLGEYFTDLAKIWNSSASDAVRKAMIEGAVLGKSATQTAARARQLLDRNADNKQRDSEVIRSLRRTVRTETFRIYRETTREVYKENGIERWQWRSARSARTCVICWAMDGKIFPVSEPLESHINCRCTKLPVLRESDIGERESGAKAFKKLEKGYQKQILGAERFKLYESGEISEIERFVARGESEDWGGYRYQIPLSKLTGEPKNGQGNLAIKVPLGDVERQKEIDSTRFATEAEARTYARGIGFAAADFGQRLDIAEVAMGAFDEIESQQLGLEIPQQIVVSARKLTKILNENGEQLDDTAAAFVFPDNIIYINEKSEFWNDPIKVAKELSDIQFLSSESPFHAIFHEYAHFLHWRYNPQRFAEIADEQLTQDVANAFAHYVSTRAAADPYEFVSEIGAGMLAGKTYPEEIMSWYDYFGGVRLR